MNWVKRLWRGEAPLWFAYWVVGVLGGGILRVITARWEEARWDTVALGVPYLVLLLAGIVWSLFSCVAIWRCAPNTGSGLWTVLARILVVVGVLVSVVQVLSAFRAGVMER